jgi:nitrogen regulatory protein P-II 1
MNMKKLEVIFAHERLIEINNLLHKHRVGGMSFHLIRGRGSSKDEVISTGRGLERKVPEFITRTKVEVVSTDETATRIIDDILKVMSTGSNRSGKIFVYDVVEAYDFKNKDTGVAAL